MPRSINATEIFRKLRFVDVYDQVAGGGSTTTAEAITAGMDEVDITASTSFTTADPVFIEGTGGLERTAITGTLATTPCLLNRPLLLAQDNGATFIEAVRKQLGYIEQAGANLNFAKQLEDILAANADNPVAFIEGAFTMECNFSLLSQSPLNWQLMLGYADAETGAGSAADPHAVVLGATDQAASPTRIFSLSALLQGGKFFELDMVGARMTVSGGPTFGRSVSSIPIGFRFTQAMIRTWAG
jgi:hypothetical protein